MAAKAFEGCAPTQATLYNKQYPPCRAELLSRFVPRPAPAVPSFAGALLERMAARVLVFFVRHAALVRPLNQHGRLQLAKVSCLLSVSSLTVRSLAIGCRHCVRGRW